MPTRFLRDRIGVVQVSSGGGMDVATGDARYVAKPADAPAEGQVLGITGGVPDWVDSPAGGLDPAQEAALAAADPGEVFNVRAYGATGDGTTDDRAAVQLAFDAAHAAGGGTVYFPAGTYLTSFRTPTYTSSMKVCWLVYGSNVTIEGAPGATITLTSGYASGFFVFLGVGGQATPATVDSSGSWWVDHNYNSPADSATDHPVYTMTAASAGATSVTLATAADAANFSAGDAVYIRTGQTLAVAGESLPDAEMNEVVAANSGTGVLTLKYPLAKDYAQEYFPDAGLDDATTTTATAWPAEFGVQNIEAVVARNMAVRGLTFDVRQTTGQGYVIALGSVLGYEISGCRGHLQNACLQTGGPYRTARFADNVLTVDQQTQADLVLSADKGCGDVVMADNTFIASGGVYPVFLHLHEGTYNATVQRLAIRNPPGAWANHAIQILGRSYDITIDAPDIVHLATGGGSPVYIADDTCQRTRILNPGRLTGTYDAITNGASSTRIEGTAYATNYGAVGSTLQYISFRVAYDTSPTTFNVGSLPPRCMVVSLDVYIHETFNGASSNVSLGIDGGYWGHFLEGTPLTGAQGPVDLTATRPESSAYYQGGNAYKDLEVNLVVGGATAGEAIVSLGYIQTEYITGT